jgi:hypothetical protein
VSILCVFGSKEQVDAVKDAWRSWSGVPWRRVREIVDENVNVGERSARGLEQESRIRGRWLWWPGELFQWMCGCQVGEGP